MKIAIIGAGVVGTATGEALAVNGPGGHEVSYYDPAKGLSDTAVVEQCDAAFLCVPTPHRDVKPISAALTTCVKHCQPDCLVVIKSTVFPTFTESAQAGHPKLTILFSPEFLSEDSAREDSLKPARQIVGYTQGNERHAHALLEKLPPAPYQAVMKATEAELVKYLSNGFFAVKVAFMNLMYDLSQEVGVSYRPLLEAAKHDPMISPFHLEPNHKGYRGFGGKCLPKDLSTLSDALVDRSLDSSRILEAVLAYNMELLSYRTCEKCGCEYEDEDPPVSTAGTEPPLCDQCWHERDT